MFSSLPSASKIYQSSVNPRQKSASATKKKRRKLHSNVSHCVSHADDTVISLMSADSELFPSNHNEFHVTRFHPCEQEDSTPEVSLNTVKNSENPRNYENRCDDDEESDELGKSLEVQQEKEICEEQTDELCNENLAILSTNSEDINIGGKEDLKKHSPESHTTEKVLLQSDTCVIFPSEIVSLEESKTSCHAENLSEITSESINEKERIIDELETIIEFESTQDFVSEQIIVEKDPFDSNNEILMAVTQCSIETNNSNSDADMQLDENIYKEKNLFLAILDEKDDILAPQLNEDNYLNKTDALDQNKFDNLNITCSKDKKHNDSFTILPKEEHILEQFDQNENLIIESINKSNENNCCIIDNSFNALMNDEFVSSSVDKMDFSIRIQSPEQSELSCTESLNEIKESCQDSSYNESQIETPSKEANNDSSSDQDFKEESIIKSCSKMSQSFSDLLCENMQPPIANRSYSFPGDFHTVEKRIVEPSPFVTITYADKETLTADIECESSYKESSVNENDFDENSQSDSSEHPLASKSISGSVQTIALGNVLPPLAMIKARARSYVFGSKGLTGSLLGNEELSRYFPDNKVTIFVGTWNMNSHDPPSNIDDFLLPLDINTLPDIYAIGVQESMQSRLEWEVLLQTTIGPSHVLFTSSSLGVLHLCIFLRRDLIWFCSEPEDASVATRPGTMVKTKGAVAVCFMFFGSSLLFVNSHLTAHQQKLKERLSDYEKIISSLDLPKSIPFKANSQDKDVTARFDCVFWCGDLNFRVERDRPSVLTFVEARKPSCSFLVKRDQLHCAMTKGLAFKGFEEGIIRFIPSYKFDVGTTTFSSSKLRVPSYTDRILYRSNEKCLISCLHYDTVPDILTSDHKPVFGVFKVTLKPGRDNVPLAAGMFKRDVYLEAIKRRSKFLEVRHNERHSAICSVM
ncbi:inositol polyphosphate 5-phosphatase E [Caerostris darwini]|uniref:Inositol polyphosphate 5-phosphatase E n=1 Tax=Caerostris darwini TaxID=1538125 RepID=A0AAV4WJH3_9ARAC|nr:inositol polyphosphate 5-phosphatase E [Caerostris darwini]